MNISDTICSTATPQGIGALAMIRLSGKNAFPIASKLFKNQNAFLDLQPNYAKWSEVFDNDVIIDQLVVVKFANPHSYSGEDLVEFTCHGSRFIQQKILELLIRYGARMAEPGEFSMRAFLNGKMDLPQSEAVADLIDSQSETSHKLAINQLKGGFSKKIKSLRSQFVELAALLELELDFSEEDVEFADRTKMISLLTELKSEVTRLTDSLKLGNV